MIDIHCHVLPAVDDGAEGLEAALAMVRMAWNDGVTALIATPHARRDLWPTLSSAVIEQRVASLVEHAGGAPPRVLPGSEIAVDSELLEELDRGTGASLVSLAGSRYLLLEFDPLGLGPDPAALSHELRIAGWWPVIAHPERIPYLAEDAGRLRAVVEAGALLQVTAMSLTGGFGRWVQGCAEFLVEEGLVHFVATDAHNPTTRPPLLSPAAEWMGRRWGDEVARRLVERNPAAVLAGEPLACLKESA